MQVPEVFVLADDNGPTMEWLCVSLDKERFLCIHILPHILGEVKSGQINITEFLKNNLDSLFMLEKDGYNTISDKVEMSEIPDIGYLENNA